MFKKILFTLFIIFFNHTKIKSINTDDAYNLYTQYIDENNMQYILTSLYKKQPSFFIEDPSAYFPINSNNIEDFVFILDPLINFFEPLLWGNIVFPIHIDFLSDSLDKVIKKSNNTDIEKIINTDIIILKGGTYPAMKKQLLYVNALSNKYNQNIPVFIIADSSRLNTNLYYESLDYIIEDIQSTINRALTNDDLSFIATHLNNEYSLALIINRFFNLNNLNVIDLEYDPLLLEFNDLLLSMNYEKANILAISNDIFTSYNELLYFINALDNSTLINPNYPVTFGGSDIPLIDPINPEGISLRKLKMITVLLNLIASNIDN